jgi:ferritin
MLHERMEAAINEQIKWELYSAYLYKSMEAYFEAENMVGMAAWMRAQTKEELCHAMIMFSHVIERGSRIKLAPIDGPETEWASALAVFQHALEHEQQVTARINALVDTAIELKDHATTQFLQWFVTEQVEEESAASAVVGKLKLMQGAPGGLYQLDQELGTRVFTMPTPAVGIV